MPPRSPSFQQVLAEAVADLRAHGYDSKTRVQKWVRALRRAAETATGSPHLLEDEIRRTLRKAYSQQVTGGVLARRQGVPAYTVRNLSPALQRELSRRIQAAADLITLNRTQAIERTLQRFSGWATAQNPGRGTPEKVREIRADIARPVRSQPFEKRRVIIDQTAKLNSNINYLVASDNKAIAVVWDANAGRPNYNHRKEHLARDGKIYVLRDGWAYRQGLITRGAGIYEDMDGFGELPFCSCRGRYLYHLDQLPDDMLTEKARKALGTERKVAP